MDVKSFALAMYPYWILGGFMVFAASQTKYRNLVRVEKKAIATWMRFLFVVAIYRILLFKILPHIQYIQDAAKNASIIPLPITLTVFWEDACHGLPLLLLRKFIGTSKWTWPIHLIVTAILMFEFGLGHVYQGVIPAILLSLYIPYSVKLGEKYGFGTVMLGHIAYDFTTLLCLRMLAGI